MVTEKSISQISDLWKEEKRQFVKKSTFAAYSLIVETHLLPAFGHLTAVTEKDVQDFVLHKLNGGLSQKTIKDIIGIEAAPQSCKRKLFRVDKRHYADRTADLSELLQKTA